MNKTPEHWQQFEDILAAAVRLHRDGQPAFARFEGTLYGRVRLWATAAGVPPSTAMRRVAPYIGHHERSYAPFRGLPLNEQDLLRCLRKRLRVHADEMPPFPEGPPARPARESERVAAEVLETAVQRLLGGRKHPFRREGQEIRLLVREGAELRNQDPRAFATGMRMLGLWRESMAGRRPPASWAKRGRPIDVKAFLDYVRSRPDMDVRQVARALRELPQTPKPRVGRPPTKALERYAELCEQGLPIPDALLKRLGKSS